MHANTIPKHTIPQHDDSVTCIHTIRLTCGVGASIAQGPKAQAALINRHRQLTARVTSSCQRKRARPRTCIHIKQGAPTAMCVYQSPHGHSVAQCWSLCTHTACMPVTCCLVPPPTHSAHPIRHREHRQMISIVSSVVRTALLMLEETTLQCCHPVSALAAFRNDSCCSCSWQ
jgi:hypothetical protein